MPLASLFHILADHIVSYVFRGGYPILFILTVLEGIPLAGMIVPGHVAIFLAGFMARLGILDLGWVMVLACIGAIVGDYIGFMIGRKYGMSFIDRLRPYFFISDAQIERVRGILDKHTGKALILGRWSPFTRALMPFFVGTTHAPARRFWIYNLIGGISWSVVSVLIGYAFGAGYHVIGRYIGRVSVVAVIVAILIIWGYRFVNQRFHIFRRYELFTLSLNIISLGFLVKTLQDAWASSSFMANFDIWVNTFMVTHISPLEAQIASVVSLVGGVEVMSVLGALLSLYLALKKRWRSAIIALLSVGSTAFVVGTMKEFFLRARPEDALQLTLSDPSFPSAHAAFAAAFFVSFAYLMAPKIRSWVKREIMIALCIAAVIAVGLSRIVLNVHWASDVIAGWSVGVFMATACILIVRYVGALMVKHVPPPLP